MSSYSDTLSQSESDSSDSEEFETNDVLAGFEHPYMQISMLQGPDEGVQMSSNLLEWKKVHRGELANGFKVFSFWSFFKKKKKNEPTQTILNFFSEVHCVAKQNATWKSGSSFGGSFLFFCFFFFFSGNAHPFHQRCMLARLTKPKTNKDWVFFFSFLFFFLV
jgi:hypothetical protein